MNTVKFGSKGADVMTLQMALNSAGYSLSADGIFGAKTEAAVKDYQRKNGLTVDGIAGPKTWSRLGYETMEKPESRFINEIILHCSATPEGRDVSSATIDAGHKARKFSSYRDPKTGKTMYVGYHYIIHPDGRIEACRPESVRGCHASGHNANSIGICYIGGYASDGKTVKDTRTPQQKAAIESLVSRLCAQLPIVRIIGHRDTSPDLNGNGIIEPFEWLKACPCFDAKTEYAHILKK